MNSSEPLCKSLSEVDDFIAFLVLYAPKLPARRNLTLESAFAKLIHSLEQCRAEFGDAEGLSKAKALATSAFAAYEQQRRVEGAHMLQDLSALLSA